MLKNSKIFAISLIILLLTLGEVAESSSEQKLFEVKLQFNGEDLLFYAELNMGKDIIQKGFKFIIDTGSQLTWVFQKECTNCNYSQNNLQARICEGDACSQNQSQHQNLYYGFGSVEYYETFDYIRLIADANGQCIVVPLRMGHVTNISEELNRIKYDGLLGLSPFSETSSKSFMDSLIMNKWINQNVFSIKFSKLNPMLFIGGIKQELIPANYQMQQIPIKIEDEQWKLTLKDFKVGDNSLKFIQIVSGQQLVHQSFDYQCLIDSGTNYIVVSDDVNQAIGQSLKDYGFQCILVQEENSKFNQLKCISEYDKTDKFPPLNFIFADQYGKEFLASLPPQQYIHYNDAQKMSYVKILSKPYKQKENRNTQGEKIEETGDQNESIVSEIILGFPFLQNYYIIFDKDNQQITLVKLNEVTQTEITISSTKYILVGLLVILVCFLTAYQIIRKIN